MYVNQRETSGLTKEWEQFSVADLLKHALETSACRARFSFQAEASVLVDLICRFWGTDFRIFTLDTGRLHQETYECMDQIRERYGVRIDVYFPEA